MENDQTAKFATCPRSRATLLREMLNIVAKKESFLFTDAQWHIWSEVEQATDDSLNLLFRLIQRRDIYSWKRLFKQNSTIRAAEELVALGIAQDFKQISIFDALMLLKISELRQIAKRFRIANMTCMNKSSIVDALASCEKGQSTLAKTSLIKSVVIERIDFCIRLSSQSVQFFRRLFIVFFRTVEFYDHWLTYPLLSHYNKINYPAYQTMRSSSIFPSIDVLVRYEYTLQMQKDFLEIMESFKADQCQQKRARDIFDDALEKWQFEVAMENDCSIECLQDDCSNEWNSQENSARYYLQRFKPGWVLTRIVYKGLANLAKNHEHRYEHQILTLLLSQKHYYRGKRGAWYDRKALLEQHHMHKYTENPIYWKKEALNTAIKGIQDPDSHLCYQLPLQRRIYRLQRALKLAKKDQLDFFYCTLKTAPIRRIKARRVSNPIVGNHVYYLANHEELLSVEALCISEYAKEGWKGIHSESSILTTIFALLFWDILFMHVNGVFESPYQTAPLDLFSDSFYPNRFKQINDRIELIASDNYSDIIINVYDRERPNKTCCQGLHWDYPLDDILQIAQCIGQKGLSQICRYFAEEYGHRTGGVPDLCLWNYDKKICKFVEVKSKNDKLSETQKVWLDLLLSISVPAEVCLVEDDNEIS